MKTETGMNKINIKGPVGVASNTPVRKARLQINWAPSLCFTSRPCWSPPQKLTREIPAKGSQNQSGQENIQETRSTAPRIPTPAPLGMIPEWELRWLEISLAPILAPKRPIPQAPKNPARKQKTMSMRIISWGSRQEMRPRWS